MKVPVSMRTDVVGSLLRPPDLKEARLSYDERKITAQELREVEDRAVCEAVRLCCPEAILLNASTNKVYGGMEDVRIAEADGRYRYADLPQGVSEERPLDFHSPYGCSKGAGDQYVRDYARIYNLRTVTFRQSCIYGTRQFGVEDQGWVAWFTIAAALGLPSPSTGTGSGTPHPGLNGYSIRKAPPSRAWGWSDDSARRQGGSGFERRGVPGAALQAAVGA